MHPELLNNAVFLRYYRHWQADPSSIVFAPIAEFFLRYGMIDDAFRVCRAGVKRHPALVSGRIVMARIHLARGNWEEAEEELRRVQAIVPQNASAREMMEEIASVRQRERDAGVEVHPARAFVPLAGVKLGDSSRGAEGDEAAGLPRPIAPSWKTVTMANIFAAQGHVEQARGIYQAILASDPANEAARRGLAAL